MENKLKKLQNLLDKMDSPNVMNERQLARVNNLIQSIDSGAVQADEFAKAVKAILDVIKEVKTNIESDIAKIESGHSDKMGELDLTTSQLENLIKEVESTSIEYTKETVSRLEDRITSIIKDIKDSIPNMPDLSDINTKINSISDKIKAIED